MKDTLKRKKSQEKDKEERKTKEKGDNRTRLYLFERI
jgi:hypothetical protein